MQEQHESNQLRLILLLTTDRKCNLLVKSCMHQMLNANKNCMQIPTGGTVSVNEI